MATTQPAEHPTRRRSNAPREILDATQALVLAEGAEGLSIRKVSERCGYSAPTIYHHFGDKQGLVDALVEERFRIVHQAMIAIPRSDDSVLHLREMAHAFLAFARENPDHYRLMMEPGLRGESFVPSAAAVRALVREDLEELSRRGSLATSDIDAAFHVLWAMLTGLITLQITPRPEEVPDGLEDLTLHVVETGLLQRSTAR